MSFLAKGNKQDLSDLAEELGEPVDAAMRIVDLKQIILKSTNYDEESAKIALTRIIEERKVRNEREQEEIERDRVLQGKTKIHEFELQRLNVQLELEKLKLQEAERTATFESRTGPTPTTHVHKSQSALMQLTPKFEKTQDLQLYLKLFESRATIANVPKNEWVSFLLGLLPPDLTEQIAREDIEEVKDYDFVKNFLIKTCKQNPEKLRQLFYSHRRDNTTSWRTYAHELNTYFSEYLRELEIDTFDKLRDLIVANQLKFRVNDECKEHFIDKWATFTAPFEVADKLDQYESVRSTLRKGKSLSKQKNPAEPLYNKNSFKTSVRSTEERNFPNYSQKGYKNPVRNFYQSKNKPYWQNQNKFQYSQQQTQNFHPYRNKSQNQNGKDMPESTSHYDHITNEEIPVQDNKGGNPEQKQDKNNA